MYVFHAAHIVCALLTYHPHTALSDGASSLISVPLTETQSSKAYAGSEASSDIDNDIKRPLLMPKYVSHRSRGDSFEVIGEEDLEDSPENRWKCEKHEAEQTSLGEAGVGEAMYPSDGPSIQSDYTKLSGSFAFSEGANDPSEAFAAAPDSSSLARPPLYDVLDAADADPVDELEPAADDLANEAFDPRGHEAGPRQEQLDFQVGPNAEQADDFADQQQVDLEIHLVLDELIGIRAPLAILIRNASWLIVFNGTFIVLFGYVPFCLGTWVHGHVFSEVPHLVGSYICQQPDNACVVTSLRWVI